MQYIKFFKADPYNKGNPNKPCSIDGCKGWHFAKGYCCNHYRLFKRHGVPYSKASFNFGKNIPQINPDGYFQINVNRKPRRVHRILMEEHIGRKLLQDEVVHHINGNKLDNRIDNLEILFASEHRKLHRPKQVFNIEKPCSKCGKIKPLNKFYYIKNKECYCSWCNACVSKAVVKKYWTDENERDKRKKYSHEYFQKNKQIINEKKKVYRMKNRKRINFLRRKLRANRKKLGLVQI